VAATYSYGVSWDESAAESRIVGIGLTVGSISTVNNCIAPSTVQVQHPSAGTAVALRSTVDFTISTCTSYGGGDGPPRQEQ
jgi:beta-lactam-binding protein with PASTA domain